MLGPDLRRVARDAVGVADPGPADAFPNSTATGIAVATTTAVSSESHAPATAPATGTANVTYYYIITSCQAPAGARLSAGA